MEGKYTELQVISMQRIYMYKVNFIMQSYKDWTGIFSH